MTLSALIDTIFCAGIFGVSLLGHLRIVYGTGINTFITTAVGILLIGSIPGGCWVRTYNTRLTVPRLRHLLCTVLLAIGARMLWVSKKSREHAHGSKAVKRVRKLSVAREGHLRARALRGHDDAEVASDLSVTHFYTKTPDGYEIERKGLKVRGGRQTN